MTSLTKFQRSAVDDNGNVLPNALIEIFYAGTTGKPQLFSGESGTPKTNPFNADENGFIEFYVGFGRYDIELNGADAWTNEKIGEPVFDTRAQLSAVIQYLANGDSVSTKGCDAIADGGHGTFDIVASTSLPVDGYAVIGSGPYAVLRPADDGSYNIMQFGARKGNVGAYASANVTAIQNAINYASATASKTITGAGTFLIDNTITVPNPVKIVVPGGFAVGGDSAMRVIKNTAGNMLNVTAKNSFCMSGVELIHNGASGLILNLSEAESARIYGCTFRAAPLGGTATGNSVYFSGSNTWIDKCLFAYGRTANPNTHYHLVCDDPSSGGNININSKITNCLFGGQTSGVLVGSNSSGRPEGLLIDNNVFILEGFYGVHIKNVLQCDISNNMIDGPSIHSVYLDSQGTSGGIDGVAISGRYQSTGSNATGVSGGVAISVNPSSTLACSNIKIINVVFAQCAYGIVMNANAAAGGTVNHVLIDGCTFNNVDQSLLFLKNVNNAKIINNDFEAAKPIALEDGAFGSYIIENNHFGAGTSIIRTVTNADNFTWGVNRGLRTKAKVKATTAVLTTGTSTYLNIPHGLVFPPNLDKCQATVKQVTGSALINNIVNVVGLNVDQTAVTVQVFYSTASGTGAVQVNLDVEI